MSIRANDFVLHIATANGSGSQSANLILVKTLFRMGVPVGGKNLFPSNIQGLPTWFTIRANPQGFVSRKPQQDIVITLNPATANEDASGLRPGGLFIYGDDCKVQPEQLRKDTFNVAVPFKVLAGQASDSVKAKKLLANMVYVGILARQLNLDLDVLKRTVQEQFKSKTNLLEANLKAVDAGYQWAAEFAANWPQVARAETVADGNRDLLLIDGNTASGMGLISGGCTVAAWYPITPSSSVMDSLIKYGESWRKDKTGKSRLAVVQAEDELAAISMVIGAGWAGARAVTATSGPGLSLMAEAAGLSYFAEIPAVIWDVQRVGPSTGLPTRTMQGDVTAAARLSHGDTKHVLLFPSDPAECFEMGQTAFDLAEQLQTLVIVLSDLDIGMNLHRTRRFHVSNQEYDRGAVLNAEDLEKIPVFARYSDPQGSGVGPRTLPGTRSDKAAYFTRGTGHDEFSRYSESPTVFAKNLKRLMKKWQTAKSLVPKPESVIKPGAKVGLVYYGSTAAIIPEVQDLTKDQTHFSTLRIKAYPFTQEVADFLSHHETIIVLEQNRDGQMRELLSAEFPEYAAKTKSLVRFDGWPLAASEIAPELVRMLP